MSLDFAICRQRAELRHKTPVATDCTTHELGMSEMIQPAPHPIAGSRGEKQRKVSRLTARSKTPSNGFGYGFRVSAATKSSRDHHPIVFDEQCSLIRRNNLHLKTP
jgi:hypothetical protein